jgi:uncharacterized protein YraI
MNAVLDIFNPQVTKSGGTITVTYCHLNYSGTCTYNETTLQGTKFKQRVNILINTDMDDVIEYLYKIGEVTGPQDLERISYLIQTHSRSQIE